MKPFRFLAEARAIVSAPELAETARRAEGIGIDTLVIPDHLIPQLAPIPELGISSIMVGEVDELVPVVERLAGT